MEHEIVGLLGEIVRKLMLYLHEEATYDMNPYPAYRPSGVEWLGEVPEHWDVQRAKTSGVRIREWVGPTYGANEAADGVDDPDLRAIHPLIDGASTTADGHARR